MGSLKDVALANWNESKLDLATAQGNDADADEAHNNARIHHENMSEALAKAEAHEAAKKAEAAADVAERAAARARSAALKEFKLSTTARIEAVDAKADALRKAKVAAGNLRTHMAKNYHMAL